MKLNQLKNKLLQKNNENGNKRISSVRREFEKSNIVSDIILEGNVETNANELRVLKPKNLTSIMTSDSQVTSNNNVKIIGITGSKGKSTTAYLVHSYLKAKGYKTMLYSSLSIDSPASFSKKDEACDTPLGSENMLLNIIEEAEAYEAEYVVMEINDRAIAKGLTQEIPFTIRALTNLERKHNLELYTEEEYVNIKKSFFQNIPVDEECTCIFGLTDGLNRESLNELLRLNNSPKRTYGTKFTCEAHNTDYNNIDYLLCGSRHNAIDSLNGLDMKIRVKNNVYDFITNMILPHNAFNITCAIAIIDALDVFDYEAFNDIIRNIKIPGREEVIKAGGRTIIVGLSIIPALEVFKKYKQNSTEINQIKVVVGAHGSGFSTWDPEFMSAHFLNERNKARKYAMNYVKNNADYVYLTENDNGAEDPYMIASELKSYLEDAIPSEIEVDREKAIKKAITNSQIGDIIFIAGRGNRRVLCNTATTVKLINDKEVVEETVSTLGWI